MSYQRPSDERGGESSVTLDGETYRDGPDEVELKLYGEPCHETKSEPDEQTLYGKPQHEPREESDEVSDLELVLARL